MAVLPAAIDVVLEPRVMGALRRCACNRNAGSFRFDHLIENGRMGRGQADAAMRGRAAERARLISPMDCIAAGKKDGMRHGRHVILF